MLFLVISPIGLVSKKKKKQVLTYRKQLSNAKTCERLKSIIDLLNVAVDY